MKNFTLADLEKMIEDHSCYWECRLAGRATSDLQGEAANVLNQNLLPIAKDYIALVKAVRDYLKHPSEDGSPLRREKRRGLAAMVADKE